MLSNRDAIEAPTFPATSNDVQSTSTILKKTIQPTTTTITTDNQVKAQDTISKTETTMNQNQANNNTKSYFRDYVSQLYTLLDQVAADQPIINLSTIVIQQLEAISEKTITGKKQGSLRQQLVYDETIQYLNNHKITLDDTSKTLLRGLIQINFDKDENKLLKIFSDVFETATGCINSCSSSGMFSLLSNIIPTLIK